MSRTPRAPSTCMLLASLVVAGAELACREKGRGSQATGAKTGVELTLDEAKARFEAGAVFIDARPLDRYVAGHVPGAHHFHAETILDRAETIMNHIGFGEPVVIYCDGGSCEDSQHAYRDLRRIGYEALFIFEDGWEEWSRPEHGLPTETGESPFDAAAPAASSPDDPDAESAEPVAE